MQMAPDYDHLTLMQKVEVFEHAVNNTAGDDLAKLLWLKSPSSEVRPRASSLRCFGRPCSRQGVFAACSGWGAPAGPLCHGQLRTARGLPRPR